ncbi:MAG: hypothetical protein P4L40_15115 [Terracidiphilus sp.]|nr:hypothetical protein [Terracidiphilus sp.]
MAAVFFLECLCVCVCVSLFVFTMNGPATLTHSVTHTLTIVACAVPLRERL